MAKKKATALKYEQGYNVPVVTATGMGYVADKIIEKAEESNVPIVYDKELVEVLNNVDIGEDIPYELYDTVAQVIAYVMDIDEVMGRR